MKRTSEPWLTALLLPIPLIGLGMFLILLVFLNESNTESPVLEGADLAPATLSPQAAAIATIQAAPDRTRPQVHDQMVALLFEQGEYFDTSGVCSSCHTNLTDSSGHNVSIDTQWRSTMMANSGRDPYWRAGLRREVLSNPDFGDFIQDKCATCHMPMARTTINLTTGDYALVFGENGLAQASHPYHNLAMDSISCTLCHQITDTDLGEREGFSGHYSIDTSTSPEERIAFGPFAAGAEQTTLMQNATGFIPTQSDHIQSSELCATCHELYTPYFDVETRELAAVEFPEQTPYGEWLHSAYRDTNTCQSCHMPIADGLVAVSSVGGFPARPDFSQHIFVGGNVYMLRIFQQFGEELSVTASPEQFQNTIDLTRQQLQNDTATLTLENVQLEGGVLTWDTVIQTLTGHKLPASYPSRRAWLHVTVRDAEGNIVFESGAYEDNGAIIGNDNDADPMQFEPHYDLITDPEQVQIYEPIMGDTSGNVTTTLLLASVYLKDNRLLPLGFDKETAPPEVGVYGEARQDEDFIGGRDTVTYQIAVEGSQGPFTVEAELVYQTIAYRWAENLRPLADPEIAPEIVAFLEYYAAVPNIPERIATASAEIE